MNIINITKDAVQYLSSALGISEDDAQEHLMMAFDLCQIPETDPAKQSPTPSPTVDDIILTLAELSESKGHDLYGIFFRNAGVGFQWFDNNKAGPQPHSEDIAQYNILMHEWTRSGLVVYGYHYSIGAAIAAEMKRFSEMEVKPS